SCAHWPLAKLMTMADKMSCTRRPIGETWRGLHTIARHRPAAQLRADRGRGELHARRRPWTWPAWPYPGPRNHRRRKKGHSVQMLFGQKTLSTDAKQSK